MTFVYRRLKCHARSRHVMSLGRAPHIARDVVDVPALLDDIILHLLPVERLFLLARQVTQRVAGKPERPRGKGTVRGVCLRASPQSHGCRKGPSIGDRAGVFPANALDSLSDLGGASQLAVAPTMLLDARDDETESQALRLSCRAAQDQHMRHAAQTTPGPPARPATPRHHTHDDSSRMNGRSAPAHRLHQVNALTFKRAWHARARLTTRTWIFSRVKRL